MNNFLDFSYNVLNLLDNKIHNTIKGTVADKFLHELQDYFKLQECNNILETISPNTNLHLAKFESDYAVCFDYSSKTIYNIPKSYIKGTEPEIGDAIKVISSKEFRVDCSGIPADTNNIDSLLAECSYKNSKVKLNIFPNYYKITDINNDFAICKDINKNQTENIPIDDIPDNAKIGDTLIFKNGKFYIK